MKRLQTGYTEENLLDGLAKNVVINRLRRDVCSAMPLPTTSEMRAFYKANLDVFEVTPERALAKRILLVIPEYEDEEENDFEDNLAERQFLLDARKTVKKKATELLKRLKEGEDFESLADRRTEDPTGIGRGGSLGWVTPGSLKNPPLENIVFSQEVGALPDEPALVDDGYAIVLVEDRRAPVYQPFKEVIPRVIHGIQIEAFKQWLALKRRNARIQYYEDLPMARVLEGEQPKQTYIN